MLSCRAGAKFGATVSAPMLKLVSRVLALAVACIVAGAMFVTAMAVWSWLLPPGSVPRGVTYPSENGSAQPDRLQSTPYPR